MGEIFERRDMTGSVFRDVNLEKSQLENVNLGGAIFKNVNLGGAVINSANLAGLYIKDANILDFTISGIRIDELFEAIDAKAMNFEPGTLGALQASSLIAKLLDIRDNGPNGDALLPDCPPGRARRKSWVYYLLVFSGLWWLWS